MALATGVVVANDYYAQPLEDTLARAFHATTGAVGLVIMLFQIGYAIGLATLVPLGDLLERRRLLAVMLGVTVLGLVGMATAPSLAVLAWAAVLASLTSVAVQVIVPFAAHVAAAHERGKVVGTVMSGLLLGVLLSRTVSGLVASVAGWRAVFALGGLATAAVAVLLWRQLPTLTPAVQMRYSTLMASVVRLVREEPVLRVRIRYGALTFASFSAFWVSAGFLLARPPYAWNNAAIGAFALIGAIGALAAKFAGRLADRGLARVATGGFLVVMAVSYVALAIGGQSVVALGIGVALMDLGCQGAHISNQSLIYSLRPEAHSRLNTAYMTSYFVAGAIGSGLSAVVYPHFGWSGVCVLGAAFPTVAALLWVGEMTRRRR
ncbi:MAG: MFS transporter [Pseudonocardiales bacterium]|nr:MFS transporter [Pseudonocardiales bacterium]